MLGVRFGYGFYGGEFQAAAGRRAVSRDPLPSGPFAEMGIDHRINANIAAGIWFFHLFAKLEKEAFK